MSLVPQPNNQPLNIGWTPTPIKTAPIIQPTDEEIYNMAAQTASKKYGVNVTPYMLKSVRQQESSNKVDKNDYGRSMGLTPTAKAELGKDYLPDTSLANSVQNSANYLGKRAVHVYPNGKKLDLSQTPENQVKWYVQKYVGLQPGQTRVINGQKVSYEQIAKLFGDILMSNQPKQSTTRQYAELPR